mgnify:CR=1 FL=1
MRARDTESISEGERIVVTFEGRPIEARRNETVAAALSASGILAWRSTRSGAERGVFCGMGVCQDCLISVDGRLQRACMTRIVRPLELRRQRHAATASAPSMPETAAAGAAPLRPQLLVIGGGPAGLAAATTAARSGVDVLLVDERPALGGQYYKQTADSPDLPSSRLADAQMAAGRQRIDAARRAGVQVLQATEVIAAFEPRSVVIADASGARVVLPERIVIATGAYEKPRPVPGWTLPGVMTTGAVQTLLRSYRVLPGRRVLIVGNGPLNHQVALELARAGAEVVAVAEAAPPPWRARARSLAAMTFSNAGLAAKGLATLAELRLRRVPLIFGSVPEKVEATRNGLVVTLRDPGSGRQALLTTDIVAMSYGFEPSSEVARLLGCRHEIDARGCLATVTGDGFETSVPGVYAVGDCTGLGGAHAAEAAGGLAGLAVALSLGRLNSASAAATAMGMRKNLIRHRRFQTALWQVFAVAPSAKSGGPAEAVACRCEEVTLDRLSSQEEASLPGSLKRATRTGMGRCQARYCGRIVRELSGDRGEPPLPDGGAFAPRPPVKPVPIGLLAGLELPDA